MVVSIKELFKIFTASLVTTAAAIPLLMSGSAEDQSLETFLTPPRFNELLELGAHFSLTAMLAALWWTVLPARRMALAAAIVGTFSVVTEFSQYFVNRGVSAYDLLANFMGMLVALLILGFWYRQQLSYSRQS